MTEKQTAPAAPASLYSACSACGNTRGHARSAWSRSLMAWLYECPSCGNLATRPQLEIASKRRGITVE